ncbi:hypothetical protein Q7P35_001925 [Cladosporium inversicolor]
MEQAICDVDVRVSQNVRERMVSSRPMSWLWDEVPRREIATNRAVGAGAGAREIGMWQQKMRTDSSRENDSKGGGTAAVYRMADKLQGAGGSEWSAAMEGEAKATILDSTVPAATLRRPHDNGRACLVGGGEDVGVVKRRNTTRRRGGGGLEDDDDDDLEERRAQQQQASRCLAS